jgi:hypothetical protein
MNFANLLVYYLADDYGHAATACPIPAGRLSCPSPDHGFVVNGSRIGVAELTTLLTPVNIS